MANKEPSWGSHLFGWASRKSSADDRVRSVSAASESPGAGKSKAGSVAKAKAGSVAKAKAGSVAKAKAVAGSPVGNGNEAAFFEVKDLWAHYGKVAALKGISLHMEKGSIVTLIGANGAGKSTTLKAISGLNRPTSGEIWLEGERIDGLPAHKIVELGIAQVPEGRRLFPAMTVYENLKMGAYTRTDPRGVEEDLATIYDHFPVLRERRAQRAGTLSGGEQQMLATSRALMAKPKILMMDEPSMGLSPIMVAEIAKIILSINETMGVSILLVEQNALMALSLASRAYVLQTGTVSNEGPSEKLRNDPDLKAAYLGG